MELYPCIVSEVKRETSDCVSVVFEFEHTEPKRWKAGQFVELAVYKEEEWQTRCFTLSQAPENGKWQVTVKDNGQSGVSGYVVQQLKAGDEIRVSAPQGRFFVEPGNFRRTFYFWPAGSGITPIYAMTSSILASEPDSQVCVLYANRDHKAIIFARELEVLQLSYPGRLTVEHALSNASWLSSFSPWHYGRVGQAEVNKFIQQYPPQAQNCLYYICGPAPFMKSVKGALKDIDVPESCIHTEAFSAQPSGETIHSVSATLTLKGAAKDCTIEVEAGQTLLQAALSSPDPRAAMAYSCQAGVCGTCACRLRKGQVHMLSNMALTEQQVRDGWILSCQSVALSERLTLELGSKTGRT